ncbi:MAG: exonuclease domain-containing protein [Chitinophagales bacterium]
MKYAIIDIEATGGSPKRDKITEIAIYLYDGQEVVDSFISLINPETEIPPFIRKLTGISNDMVSDAPTFEDVAPRIQTITEDAVFVAHNVQFDYAYVKAEFKRLGYEFRREKLCTVKLSRKIFPDLPSYSLGKLCAQLEIPLSNRHRASGDAFATVKLFNLLRQNDSEEHIQHSLSRKTIEDLLPNGMTLDFLEDLPEETGVYYFHDDKGNVIYIGRTNDIRRRVIQHFVNKTPNSKLWSMIQNTFDISSEVTGSELIAEILESYEIVRLKPRYNRYMRASVYQYGVFKAYDKQGYLNLSIRKIQKEEKVTIAFSKQIHAQSALEKVAKQYRLCAKLCGLEPLKLKKDHPCVYVKQRLCKGACVGKEDAKSYNYRVHRALSLFEYQHANFMIIGEGRTIQEKSVVCIENNQFIGFGYFEPEVEPTIDVVKDGLVYYPPNPYIDKIIQKYLTKNIGETIITF